MKYLCGCDDRPGYRAEYGEDGKYRPAQDGEGFPVCPEHGEREYGWRTKIATAAGIVLIDPAGLAR